MIRNLTACLVGMLAGPMLAIAGEVDMPRDYLPKASYAKAQEQAVAEGLPVAVFLTEINTTCPICESTSNAMVKSLRNKAVWVHVKPKEGYAGLPDAVAKKFASVGTYPFLALVNPETGEVLEFTHQKEYSADNRDSLRKMKKAAKEYSKKRE